MFGVTEADADAIRTAFEQRGEFNCLHRRCFTRGGGRRIIRSFDR